MKKVLVTGGLGYIGSHTVVELQEAGFEVVIIDDLSNAELDVLDNIEKITGKRPLFEKLDLREKGSVTDFFNRNKIDGIIHFAASKAVGESVENPLLYYENNLNTLIYLLQECGIHSISKFIFSSSCTVYGEPDSLPITEDAPVKQALSPYGNTKQISEEIIFDYCEASSLQSISLRYFNPIGAHESAEIGELPKGTPQNLVPFITQTAAGLREQLSVFGDDYPTADGSCIRDYIHVVDLAKAHVVAVKRLFSEENETSCEVFNLGTGRGSSVLEVVRAFEKVTGEKVNYKIVDRRPGDVISVYADTTKANQVLGWKTENTMEDALASAWKWEQKLRSYMQSEEATEIKETRRTAQLERRVPKLKRKRRKLMLVTAIAGVLFLVSAIGLIFQSEQGTEQLYAQYYSTNDLPSVIRQGTSNTLLEKGAIAFQNGNFSDAMALFENYEASTTEPEVALYLYKGATFMEQNQYFKAIEEFELVIDSGSIDATKGFWFKAMAYLKSGDEKNATHILTDIANHIWYFNHDKANKLLKHLE